MFYYFGKRLNKLEKFILFLMGNNRVVLVNLFTTIIIAFTMVRLHFILGNLTIKLINISLQVLLNRGTS